MIFAISIFAVSLVCMVALLVLKIHALRSSRVTPPLVWLNMREAVWERWYMHALRVIAGILAHVSTGLHGHVSRALSSSATTFRLSLIRWGERMIAAMKREGQNDQRGAASLYLKEIKEYKDTLDPEGKIE